MIRTKANVKRKTGCYFIAVSYKMIKTLLLAHETLIRNNYKRMNSIFVEVKEEVSSKFLLISAMPSMC